MADVFNFYVQDDRSIQFNIAEPILLEDKDVTEFQFRIPKTLNGFDMSTWAWWFVYVNPKKEKYSYPLTLTDDEDEPDDYSVATFSINYGITEKEGGLQFALEAIDADAGGNVLHEWHTRTYHTAVIWTLQGNQVEYEEDITQDILSSIIEQIAVNKARIDNIAHLPEGSTTADAELIDIRVGANGETYPTAGDAVRGQVNCLTGDLDNISEIIGHDHFQNNFQTGAYSSSGVVANTGRAYCIYTGVQKGSKLFWDASKWTVNYYYLKSETDFTSLYTPNIWDSTGEIDLNYKDDGVVFVAVRAGNTGLSSRLAEINRSIWVYNNYNAEPMTYNGVVSGTTLASNNKIGLYSIGGSSTSIVSQMTDMPVSDFSGGYLLNAFVGSSASGVRQTLVEINSGTTLGRTFTRTIGYSWVGAGYVNWVAFGDSITHGSYSDAEGHTLNNPIYSYAYRIAKNLRRDAVANFYNCGVRGIGWVNTGNSGETFDDMMALFTGDKTSINLVTIMLGINDYISKETLGTTESAEKDGTISGAIRYGLKYICENYPNAKVIAISPLNSMNHGSATNGWSRNTRITGAGTLQQVCDMIQYWSNVYNVAYINEISDSFLNNYNMPAYLGDNLHPTNEGQWMLARELSRKIFI